MAMINYPHLAETIQLHPDVVLSNRTVMAPIASNMCDENGCPDNAFLSFYEKRAQGGVGAIILGAVAVQEGGGVTRNTQQLSTDQQAAALQKVVGKLRTHCPVGVQIFHAGGQGNPDFSGFENIAPSPYIHPPIGHMAREMTIKEIDHIRKAFVHSTRLAFDAGCDFVELHAAHGYLLHNFLSPYFNKRKDEYGKNIEGRSRLFFEILDGIANLSGNLISRIGVRLSAEDFIQGGLDLSFWKILLPRLEIYNLLYYHVTAGVYDSSSVKKKCMINGGFQEFSGKIKAMTARPVVTVGNIKHPDQAEDIIARQDADMVAMARALIADPDFPDKGFFGQTETINICVSCNRCNYLSRGMPEDRVRCHEYVGE